MSDRTKIYIYTYMRGAHSMQLCTGTQYSQPCSWHNVIIIHSCTDTMARNENIVLLYYAEGTTTSVENHFHYQAAPFTLLCVFPLHRSRCMRILLHMRANISIDIQHFRNASAHTHTHSYLIRNGIRRADCDCIYSSIHFCDFQTNNG